MGTQNWLAYGILIAISLALLLPRLGNNCLNGEEATVALLAESVLEHSYPYAETKLGLVTQEWGNDANGHGVWVLTPWLPVYLCAMSFKLLGISSFTARLPFVLAGVVSATILFIAARRINYNTGWSFLLALLFVANVQFLLFCRRVGPHALAVLLAALILLECLQSRSHEQMRAIRSALLRTGIWLGILFYVDYWIWLLQTAGLLSYWLCLRWTGNCSGRGKAVVSISFIALALGVNVCITLPFVAYVACSGGLPIHVLSSREAPAFYRVVYPFGGIWEASQFFMGPLLLLYALFLVFTRRHGVCRQVAACSWGFILGSLLAYAVILKMIALPSRYLYVAHLIPAFTFLCVEWLRGLAAHQRLLAVAVGFLLWCTNLGEIWLPWFGQLDATNRHFVPPRWRSYQVEYVMELWRVHRGPVDRLVDYLREQGNKVRIVFASYEVEPLMFHLGSMPVRVLPLPVTPDVIVLRAGWTCDYDNVLVASAWKPTTTEGYRVSWQRAASGKEMEVHCTYLRRFINVSGFRHIALPPAEHWRQNSDETRTRYFCPDDRLREVELWLRSGL